MASFTDNIQALSTFNPYVEQQPIEAMRAVGMQKQQQFDQGVQLIQTSIDKVAGLDIIKDSEKKYLQSKLDSLATNLQTVAAGDFSNFQLANSTAGMASRIGNDKRIQNAVGSTARIRKQTSLAEVAKESGKSAIENEDYLQTQINDYLANPNPSSAFNGEYVPYTDVNKKLREVTEKLHEVDVTLDDPFIRDASGKHVLDAKGNPMYDNDMLSTTTKGKSAERILNNFYSSLDENDKRQLKISALYHYKGASLETFRNDAIQTSIKRKEQLNKEVVDLNVMLDTTKGLTQAKKDAIQAQITAKATEVSTGIIEKQLAEQLAKINSYKDPDEFKSDLYTQKSLTQLADALSYESYSKEYKNNPGAQMGMEKKNLQFKYDNANREQQNFMAELAWKQQSFGMTYAQEERKMAADALKNAPKKGAQPITGPGRVSTEVALPTILDVNKDINVLDVGIKQLNAEYAPTLTNDSLNTPAKKQTYLDYLSRSYAEDPSTITRIHDNNLREYLEKRRSLEVKKAQKQNLFNAATDLTKKYDNEINDSFKLERGLPNANGGKGISAKQLYEFTSSLNKYHYNPNSDKAGLNKQILKDYAGTPMARLADIAYRRLTGGKIDKTEESVFLRAMEIKHKYDPLIGNINKQKVQIQSKFLADKMPEFQSINGTLSPSNKADMDVVSRLITTKAGEYLNGGVDSRELKDFDPSVVAKLRESKDVGYTIEKKYDGTANLYVVSGDKQQKIPLNAREFSSYFPEYSRKNPMTDIKYAINSSKSKTTNLKGGHAATNAVNAYMSGYDLPNLSRTPLASKVRIDVEGAGGNNGSDVDGYQVRMYVHDGNQWKTRILNTKGYANEAGVQAIFDGIGPETVKDLLKTK